jgi:hypothetical protein
MEEVYMTDGSLFWVFSLYFVQTFTGDYKGKSIVASLGPV